MRKRRKGLYIAFEGITGSGKGTQVSILVEALRGLGLDVITTREPGGDEIAEAIRKLVQGTYFEIPIEPVTEAYLYAAARSQSLRRIVKTALEQGTLVVADRSVFSSVAFQGKGRRIGIETVLNINEIALDGLIPDCVIHLDLPCEVALARTFDREGDRFEREAIEFHQGCADAYQEVGQMPQFRAIWHTIDGMGSVDDVTERVWAVIQTFIEEWQNQG